MVCMCVFVYTCMWRSEASTGCLPQFFSTLLFEAGSLHEPETHQFGRDVQEMSFWDPPIFWPCSPALCYKYMPPCLASYVGSSDLNSGPLLA